MAVEVTYKANCYCQLRLNSGERVFISFSEEGLHISKMGWLGLWPKELIAHWPPDRLTEAAMLFADPSKESQNPLDLTITRLRSCQSVSEVRILCSELPHLAFSRRAEEAAHKA